MIKYPGGEIAFWSVAFFLCSTPFAFTKFTDGKLGIGCLAAMLSICCILIWLNVRPVKWLIAAHLGLSTLGAIAMLFVNGPSLEVALVAALGAYTTYQFAAWEGHPRSNPPVA